MGTRGGGEHLTERQKKWFASVEASLERDTGKTLAEWVAIARTCPESTPGRQSAWLCNRDAYNRAKVARVLAGASPGGGGGAAPEVLGAARGKAPASTAIFEAVEAAVQDFEGLVTGQRKGFSAWSRNFQFAAVRPIRGGKARLGLCVSPDADPRLEAPRNEGWSERLKAAATLDSPGQVDAALRTLLRKAWDAS